MGDQINYSQIIFSILVLEITVYQLGTDSKSYSFYFGTRDNSNPYSAHDFVMGSAP